MSEFQKAAEKAADEIIDRMDEGAIDTPFHQVIAKHFADLASTYDKLVELAKMQNAQRIHRESFMPFQNHVDSNKHKNGIAINARLAELLADPQVKAAIGGN